MGRVLLTMIQVGSALCGAAQSMVRFFFSSTLSQFLKISLQTWLIVSRAVQGIGGGGIIQLVPLVLFLDLYTSISSHFLLQVNITISDIVSLQE